MKEQKRMKLEQKLKKNGFLKNEDRLIDAVQANYKEKIIGKMGSWKSGWLYFTEESIKCPVGLLGAGGTIDISYSNIKKISKCNQGIFPIGIAITYHNAEKNKTETDYFSVWKRGVWMELISKKSGVSVG